MRGGGWTLPSRHVHDSIVIKNLFRGRFCVCIPCVVQCADNGRSSLPCELSLHVIYWWCNRCNKTASFVVRGVIHLVALLNIFLCRIYYMYFANEMFDAGSSPLFSPLW